GFSSCLSRYNFASRALLHTRRRDLLHPQTLALPTERPRKPGNRCRAFHLQPGFTPTTSRCASRPRLPELWSATRLTAPNPRTYPPLLPACWFLPTPRSSRPKFSHAVHQPAPRSHKTTCSSMKAWQVSARTFRSSFSTL